MPTVVFTDNLKRHIDCSEIDVAGETVRQALDAVFTNYKQLRGYIVDDQARLRKHMVVFIDGCGLVAVRTRPVSTRSWCITKTATISPSAFRVVARGCPKTVAAHPTDPETAWFVPGVKDECRVPVDAKFVVTRTRDGGKTFETLDKGLPGEQCYDIVFRHALDVDATGDRLIMGSSTGSLWISEDGGDSWESISAHLPQIYCARFAT
jgi:hypothetical protein